MGYYGNNCYSYGCGCYGGYSRGSGSGFALIVVLFILLIIIGATFVNGENC
ncbi:MULTISPECIES: YjcZ family sporulation protein [unclassified Lysinibacillus]|uniref:YjcZ family sporulation protein n=1 Tax=unclassified Lysinibacillus TaxID=2636778 RepID=UPI0020136B9F|nr:MULTISPECIES: YjcZ family sporulation protein [unclassified Lysinibacillus]MCL1694913.1 YjcZ family sporulation protein [Lysinibacillus sp. BPa_S21]MCL1701418.1 YjcZ family sporulation protein [Lysinibacillus sp. Bpr_S20]